MVVRGCLGVLVVGWFLCLNFNSSVRIYFLFKVREECVRKKMFFLSVMLFSFFREKLKIEINIKYFVVRLLGFMYIKFLICLYFVV